MTSSASVSRMIDRVLTAAAAAIRLPAYVPPWLTLSGRTAHDLLAATERRRRIAVAHRLGVGREVRGDPEELGRAALGEAEPGLDLVEDQQDPVFLGQGAHRLVEARLGHDPLGVAEDRLDDDRRDLLAARLEQPAQRLDVVVAGRDDRVGHRVGDAATPGQADRRVRVAELGHVVGRDADQRVVVDAVVLALELHDPVAAGVGPRDAHRVHRGFGAGDGHPDLVDPAGQLLDQLHRLDLVLRGEREADALAHPLVDVVVDPLVAVAEDDRAVAHPQVDVLVAIDVPDVPALAAIDVDRVVAPGPEVRIGATGERPHRALVHRGLGLAPERGVGAGGGLGGHAETSVRVWRLGPRDDRCVWRNASRAIVPHARERRQRDYRPDGAPMTRITQMCPDGTA